MMTFPVPSLRTTRAMADFRRPVPKSVWAANPPGSVVFTNFLRSSVSDSTAATALAATTRGECFLTCDKDIGLAKEREYELGFWEIWEEKERDENEEVREDIEIAIFAELLTLLFVWKSLVFWRVKKEHEHADCEYWIM